MYQGSVTADIKCLVSIMELSIIFEKFYQSEYSFFSNEYS